MDGQTDGRIGGRKVERREVGGEREESNEEHLSSTGFCPHYLAAFHQRHLHVLRTNGPKTEIEHSYPDPQMGSLTCSLSTVNQEKRS